MINKETDEPLKQPQDFLKLIPAATLEKLTPFKGRLDEIFAEKADFAHLKYHILDELSLFRHVDSRISEFKSQITEGIARGWIDDDDLQQYPWMRTYPFSLLQDIPTYDRIERAVRLHDVGRLMQTKTGISPKEHHFASLFVALQVDGDPAVCQAVLYHQYDVLPPNASVVDRHVQALDRMGGSGYIGIIRLLATYHKFVHPMLQKENEDDIINDGIMMTFRWPNDKNNEDKAKSFFWDEVYPFFEAKGQKHIDMIGTQAKIILDRIYGRDYRRKQLGVYEMRVLRMDNNVKVVEPVLPDYRNGLNFKIKNTLDVLIRTRGGNPDAGYGHYHFLTDEERKFYK